MTTKSKPTPNYNTHIPPEILTSDEVETSIGTLEFLDGAPLPVTAQKAYDYLDTMRGVPVYGFWSVTLYDDEGWLPVNKMTPTPSTTSRQRRTKTAALPSTLAVTPRRTTSCRSYRDGITSSGCISRGRRS